MTIPFEFSDTADYNAANPCCCQAAACAYPSIEYQSREAELCKGGWLPNMKANTTPEPYPSAFDLETYGRLVPLYKTSTFTSYSVKSGTVSQTWEYSVDHVVSQTFQWNATLNFAFTTTITSENQKALDEWPAGSAPLGPCPPESTVSAGKASAAGVAVGTAVDGLVPVTLSTPDVRPDHPTDVDDDGRPLKAGSYGWLVDGSSYSSTAPELVVNLTEGDTTCHEFRVRHICGGPGQWSKAKVFSLNSNKCCKEPEPMACSDYSTGNPQWSASQKYLSDGGSSWTSSYSNTGGDSSSDSGAGSACDGTGPDNVPLSLEGGSGFDSYLPLEWITLLNADTVKTTRTANESGTTWEWIENTNFDSTLDPGEPDPAGWRGASQHDNGTAKLEEKTTMSNDQNQGKPSVDALFSKLRSTVLRYAASYGWSGGSSTARATGGYPETEGGNYGTSHLFAKIREIRHRWEVASSYDGSGIKTQWNTGRFHDRWLAWRGEYYDWAVSKYAFLQKPKPKDATYPKLSDFWNDPSTPENEAKDALQAAIAALDEIKDPGTAPAEPKDLKPEILSSPAPWTWASTQGEQQEENIDACDPTKYGRELHEPEKPKREDYATDAQYTSAVTAYNSALASYKTAVESRKTRSKRQSPWYVITPDKWSDHRAKPPEVSTVDSPGADDIAERDHALLVYRFLLRRWEGEHHASIHVCNVRHTCNLGDPAGEIENWDRRFPTTELPPLDPAKEDPSRWSDWYQ